jgi:hypothetical protein
VDVNRASAPPLRAGSEDLDSTQARALRPPGGRTVASSPKRDRITPKDLGLLGTIAGRFRMSLDSFGQRASVHLGNGALIIIRLAANQWHAQQSSFRLAARPWAGILSHPRQAK